MWFMRYGSEQTDRETDRQTAKHRDRERLICSSDWGGVTTGKDN